MKNWFWCKKELPEQINAYLLQHEDSNDNDGNTRKSPNAHTNTLKCLSVAYDEFQSTTPALCNATNILLSCESIEINSTNREKRVKSCSMFFILD
jgi:hypothetical protein